MLLDTALPASELVSYWYYNEEISLFYNPQFTGEVLARTIFHGVINQIHLAAYTDEGVKEYCSLHVKAKL